MLERFIDPSLSVMLLIVLVKLSPLRVFTQRPDQKIFR